MEDERNYRGSNSYTDTNPTGFGQSGSYIDSMGTPFGQTSKSTKPRRNASDTSKMNKIYKPKASPGPAANTINVYGTSKPQSLNLYGASNTKPKAKPISANERENRVSSKSTSKPATKTKDTSFNKSGVAGALGSSKAKKVRSSFSKKGLIPALRGK